jgi:hypothetical protein
MFARLLCCYFTFCINTAFKKLHISPKYITMLNFRILCAGDTLTSQVRAMPHKNYSANVASTRITFTRSFVKINKLVQKLKERRRHRVKDETRVQYCYLVAAVPFALQHAPHINLAMANQGLSGVSDFQYCS